VVDTDRFNRTECSTIHFTNKPTTIEIYLQNTAWESVNYAARHNIGMHKKYGNNYFNNIFLSRCHHLHCFRAWIMPEIMPETITTINKDEIITVFLDR